MVKIRLARAGSKKRPFYHIVVTEKENPRDGSFIEEIGYYDPRLPVEKSSVNHERLEYWLSAGAQLSERVAHVAKAHKKAVLAAG
ncbi:MAG: 30S ribosomal protein S16 [Myxococcales bacterium]|jgi:small subunit ribosomal protein S16|nr:30S ribosomal protein S16 [Myxococcales bacterium]